MRTCPACKEIYDDNSTYCIHCGTKTVEYVPNPDPKPEPVIVKKKPVGWIILTVLFLVSSIVLGIMYYEESETSSYYRWEYSRIKNKADFMDNYIRIVSAVTDDGYYHKYGCRNLDTTSFYAYGIEAAKAKGYKPCPRCN